MADAVQNEQGASPASKRSARRRQRRSKVLKAVGAAAAAWEQDCAGSPNQTAADVLALRGQALLAQLEGGGEAARRAACQELRGHVLEWSLSKAGCRAVQAALQCARRADAAELAVELRGHVHEAIQSPHGNYVVQKVVEVLPTRLSAFVAEELAGSAALVARHRYGCRVLCRLLEHSAGTGPTAALVDEMLAQAGELCRHSFGHHVVQSVLEHGQPCQQQLIVTALRGDLMRQAANRNASYVIEKALALCGEGGQPSLADELLFEPEQVVQLAQSQYGGYVVKTLLRLPGEKAPKTRDTLLGAAPRLRETKHGCRLLDDVCLNSAATVEAAGPSDLGGA